MVGGYLTGIAGSNTWTLDDTELKVTVLFNWLPVGGAVPPTATWFGYIKAMWNTYEAVNKADPSQKRKITFEPKVDPAGKPISVHQGTGVERADAATFYINDTSAASTIPHEFGHLVGLEDEYMRGAADYQRGTGEALPGGDTARAVEAKAVAQKMRPAIKSPKGSTETEGQACDRRLIAIKKVMTDEHLPMYYSDEYTRQIALEYKKLYTTAIDDDMIEALKTTAGDELDMANAREELVGSFEYTNASIMGQNALAQPGSKEHAHPVQPRHVRAFADIVAAQLGGGDWDVK